MSPSFPAPGLYYIQSCSKPDRYASVRYGEDQVLRGKPIIPTEFYQKWRLDYVEDVSDRPKVFCVLTKDEGEGSLGVHSDKKYQPVCFMDDSQTWFLKQSDKGYIIGHWHVSDYHEYTWYLGNKDDTIVINVQGIMEPESWKFVSAK